MWILQLSLWLPSRGSVGKPRSSHPMQLDSWPTPLSHVELDLSACNNVQHIVDYGNISSRRSSFRSLAATRHLPITRSPSHLLYALPLREFKFLSVRVRTRAADPFGTRNVRCPVGGGGDPPRSGAFLLVFRTMGGIVVSIPSHNYTRF